MCTNADHVTFAIRNGITLHETTLVDLRNECCENHKLLKTSLNMNSIFIRSFHLLLLLLFSIVQAGNLGDQTDVIIKNIMNNYEVNAHPNSDRKDGSVMTRIGITPLSLNIVRK